MTLRFSRNVMRLFIDSTSVASLMMTTRKSNTVVLKIYEIFYLYSQKYVELVNVYTSYFGYSSLLDLYSIAFNWTYSSYVTLFGLV